MNKIAVETLSILSSLSSMQLREQLGEVLERVYYRGEQFRVVRKDKLMARIVNDLFMQHLDELIASDHALADTLALMMNDEAQDSIQEGQNEIKADKLIPFDNLKT
jgi:hypothetical protein